MHNQILTFILTVPSFPPSSKFCNLCKKCNIFHKKIFEMPYFTLCLDHNSFKSSIINGLWYIFSLKSKVWDSGKLYDAIEK